MGSIPASAVGISVIKEIDGKLNSPTTSAIWTGLITTCVGKTRGEKLGLISGKYLGHNDGLTGKIGGYSLKPTGDYMYLNPTFLRR